MAVAFILLVFHIFKCFTAVNGHGRLIDPPSRNAMWRFGYDTPPNYDDNGLNCGGFGHQWYKNKGRCGPCGDPYDHKIQQHVYPGKFANGIIVRRYQRGQIINVTVEITSNHQGYFEFRIGDIGRPPITEEKLNYLLPLAGTNGATTKYYLPKISVNGLFSVTLQLPGSLVCRNCVLQWKYTAGNSWGCDDAGGCAVGKGNQETFVNCADVQILSNTPGKQSVTVTPHLSTSILTSSIQATTINWKATETLRTTTMSTFTPSLTTPSPTISIGSSVGSATVHVTVPDTSGGASGGCRPAGVWARVAGMQGWCRQNCPGCPATHCICDTVQTTVGTSQGGTGASQGGTGVCRPVGIWKSVTGMDSWCRWNCPALCPASHCTCD